MAEIAILYEDGWYAFGWLPGFMPFIAATGIDECLNDVIEKVRPYLESRLYEDFVFTLVECRKYQDEHP